MANDRAMNPPCAAAAFDPAVFDRTVALLEPADMLHCLRTLHARGEAMLQTLRTPVFGDPALRDAVHTMAGSAGLFGFYDVTESALSLERGVDHDATASAAASALVRAVAAMLPVIRRRLPDAPITPEEIV